MQQTGRLGSFKIELSDDLYSEDAAVPDQDEQQDGTVEQHQNDGGCFCWPPSKSRPPTLLSASHWFAVCQLNDLVSAVA